MGDSIPAGVTEIEQLKNALREKEEEFDDFVSNSNAIEAELDAQVSELERQNNELKSSNARTEEELEDIREKLEELQSTSSFQVDELEDRINQLTTTNEKLKDVVRELENTNDDLERSHRNTLATLDTFEVRLSEAIERNALLESELDEKKELLATIQHLKDETRELRQDMAVRELQRRDSNASRHSSVSDLSMNPPSAPSSQSPSAHSTPSHTSSGGGHSHAVGGAGTGGHNFFSHSFHQPQTIPEVPSTSDLSTLDGSAPPVAMTTAGGDSFHGSSNSADITPTPGPYDLDQSLSANKNNNNNSRRSPNRDHPTDLHLSPLHQLESTSASRLPPASNNLPSSSVLTSSTSSTPRHHQQQQPQPRHQSSLVNSGSNHHPKGVLTPNINGLNMTPDAMAAPSVPPHLHLSSSPGNQGSPAHAAANGHVTPIKSQRRANSTPLSALEIVGDLLRKVGSLETKLHSQRNNFHNVGASPHLHKTGGGSSSSNSIGSNQSRGSLPAHVVYESHGQQQRRSPSTGGGAGSNSSSPLKRYATTDEGSAGGAAAAAAIRNSASSPGRHKQLQHQHHQYRSLGTMPAAAAAPSSNVNHHHSSYNSVTNTNNRLRGLPNGADGSAAHNMTTSTNSSTGKPKPVLTSTPAVASTSLHKMLHQQQQRQSSSPSVHGGPHPSSIVTKSVVL